MSYGYNSNSDRQGGESGAYYNPSNAFRDENPPHDAAALQHAQQYAAPSTPPSLFTTALQHLGQFQQQAAGGEQPVDEGAFASAHQTVYGGGGAQEHGAPTLGMAAAMNALKSFTGGGGGGAGAGGNSQSEFIGLAMAHASKLFDEQSLAGNVVGCPPRVSRVFSLSSCEDACKT
jgi:hypothetical protein